MDGGTHADNCILPTTTFVVVPAKNVNYTERPPMLSSRADAQPEAEGSERSSGRFLHSLRSVEMTNKQPDGMTVKRSAEMRIMRPFEMTGNCQIVVRFMTNRHKKTPDHCSKCILCAICIILFRKIFN